MATGKLGSNDLAATSYTDVYNPSGVTGAVTVSFCNRNATSVTFRLALSAAGGTPTADEFLEYGATLLANGVYERTGVVVGSGQFIVAWASTTLVSVVVMGYEDA